MNIIESTGGFPILAWTEGVEVEQSALTQLRNTSKMPFIFKHLAVMPDVHFGKGSTVGSVIPTIKAIIPAAAGVDLGCGIDAIKLSLNANHLPGNLKLIRDAIENAIPLENREQTWKEIPQNIVTVWNNSLDKRFAAIIKKHPKIEKGNTLNQIGSLGSGNHFCEICLDEHQNIWIMLHSGSRGVGNRIGSYFINIAKEEMLKIHAALPDKDLAYLQEGTTHFADYIEAIEWAQDFAKINRDVMMKNIITALRNIFPPFQLTSENISCHHNYISKEFHYNEEVYITRKGAINAELGKLGIIPGSMGAKSFIVQGKGNPESFNSCSHGAGRRMGRKEAERTFTIEDQIKATEGVECRKDAGVIDEIPYAYKDIDAVISAERDLVDVVHTLKGIVCVKA